MRIAVSGAGIAGPTLAYWLRKSAHDVLLIEKTLAIRTGGYVVDFWGLGYDIAERMGLLPRIREMGYQVQEVRFVDRHGRTSGSFPADVFGRLTGNRFTSVPRSALSSLIYEGIHGEVETLFGDSIVDIENRADGVQVVFEHAAPRLFDLVIGADGLHSRVRQLTFGSEPIFELPLGYHAAACEVDGYRPRDELVYVSYAVPGRQISRFSMRGDKTLFLFVFRDEYLRGPLPESDDDRKAALTNVFSDIGWESSQILASMQGGGDVYLDRVSQIRMSRWTDRRTALVGDAAACVSLMGGEGTGLAMAEAYVLAGELRRCGDNHIAAFARYQERLMPFLRRKQQSAARFASSFAPKTVPGLAFRDLSTRLLKIPLIADFLLGRDLRDDIRLPEYGF